MLWDPGQVNLFSQSPGLLLCGAETCIPHSQAWTGGITVKGPARGLALKRLTVSSLQELTGTVICSFSKCMSVPCARLASGRVKTDEAFVFVELPLQGWESRE